MFVVAGAAIGGAAVVYSAKKSSKTAKEAAATQSAAADRASELQYSMWKQTRADQLPWLQAGKRALGTLEKRIAAGPGKYERSPDYAVLQRAGEENINALAGSRGGYFSGAAAKELAAFNKDLASTDYDRWLDRWYKSLGPYQSLAGVGQTAGTNLAQNALSTGQIMGQYGIQGANALASGNIAAQNAMTQGYQGAANLIGKALPYAFSSSQATPAVTTSAAQPFTYESPYFGTLG